jgi:hypothetical protein
MPATGGGRAVHAVSSKRTEKSRSVESMQAPRRESVSTVQTSAASAQRPGIKNRAYSHPAVPQSQSQSHSHSKGPESGIPEDNASLYSQDGEEIANDAFFQRYHFSPPAGATPEDASERSVDSSSDTEGPLSPTHVKSRTPARDVLSGASSEDSNVDAAPPMLDMNIAVIGAAAVGKTTFMQKALGLPDTTPTTQCHRKWTMDGIPYHVRLVELKIDDIHAKPGNTIEWPKTANGMAVPRVDGAITVYDVTVKESLASVPDMMSQSIELREEARL